MSQEIKKLRYVIAVCQGRQLEVCELGSGLPAASGAGGRAVESFGVWRHNTLEIRWFGS